MMTAAMTSSGANVSGMERVMKTSAMKSLDANVPGRERVMIIAAMKSLGVKCVKDRTGHDDCCDEVLGF